MARTPALLALLVLASLRCDAAPYPAAAAPAPAADAAAAALAAAPTPAAAAAAPALAAAPAPAAAAAEAAAAPAAAAAEAAPLTSCMQPPALPGRGCAISPADRVYTGDQSSNTVTVIAPYSGTVLGTLALGDARLADVLGPQYAQAVGVHGLGFSRDGRLIVSTSVTSNTVTIIRTRDNRVVSQTSVDRQAHEAWFAADNKTVWVATRGVDSIDIVDGLAGGIICRVASAGGPSKVLFSSDGRTAYANHVRAATLSVIDVAARVVTDTITGLNDTFSSDMGLSPDGAVMYVAHKMAGTVSVVDLAARRVAAVLATGPETNHPSFAYVNGTLLGFVTVGAANATRVYAQGAPGAAPTHLADVRSSGVEPHGLWPSGDGTRLYVVNEHSDTLDVIDTSKLSVIQTLLVGQESQAVVYVSDAVPFGAGTEGLGTQGLTGAPARNVLVPVSGREASRGEALVTVRPLAGVDELQLIGRRLRPNATYTASAVCAACGGARLPLLDFVADAEDKSAPGCATAPQVLSFLKFIGVYDLDSVQVAEKQP